VDKDAVGRGGASVMEPEVVGGRRSLDPMAATGRLIVTICRRHGPRDSCRW
jgi:hypothetical protein